MFSFSLFLFLLFLFFSCIFSGAIDRIDRRRKVHMLLRRNGRSKPPVEIAKPERASAASFVSSCSLSLALSQSLWTTPGGVRHCCSLPRSLASSSPSPRPAGVFSSPKSTSAHWPSLASCVYLCAPAAATHAASRTSSALRRRSIAAVKCCGCAYVRYVCAW